MKTGIFGGTFNPIHNAHLSCAAAAQKHCSLDRIIFIPSCIPPHKELANEIPFDIRCRMVELAIEGHADWSLSKIEGERGGASYTVETLREFALLYPADDLYFIIGGDSFLDLGTWRSIEEIVRLANLVVLERPDFNFNAPLAALPVAIRGEFTYSHEPTLLHNGGKMICFAETVPIDISSSAIRELAAAGEDVAQLVPAAVDRYIKEKGVYR